MIRDYQENVNRGTGRLEQVKGCEMKEIKEERQERSRTTKVTALAILIILLIAGVIGIGCWKGMRGGV